MFLKLNHFSGLFEKIAQNITGITQSSSSSSKNYLSSGNNKSFDNSSSSNSGSLNLNSTLSKARHKADLQPLHKDTNTIFRPADAPFANKMENKQEYLSHIEDKRITKHHLLSNQ